MAKQTEEKTSEKLVKMEELDTNKGESLKRIIEVPEAAAEAMMLLQEKQGVQTWKRADDKAKITVDPAEDPATV